MLRNSQIQKNRSTVEQSTDRKRTENKSVDLHPNIQQNMPFLSREEDRETMK